MKKVIVISAVVAFAAAVPASGQIPVGAKVGELPPSAGTYNSHGNRDPFVTLIQPRRAAGPNVPRIGGTGLPSFYVDDVVVTGIIRKGEDRMAILQNVDRQSSVAKVKDRLADAVVKSIDGNSVTFVETLGPGGRSREVKKMLNSSEVKR
jgi:Tfp pilus assembly protein PilP